MGVKFNQEEMKKADRERKESLNKKQKENEVKKNKTSSGKFKIENYLAGEFELIIPSYKKISSFKSLPIKIKDIEVTAIERYTLCDGATLKCNQGDATSTYTVLPTRVFYVNDKPIAVVSDIKPMVNIKPFGQCKSMANPTVAAATAANRGQLKKMPCIPNTIGMWSEGCSHFLSDEKTACDKSKCNCAYAGQISVSDVGQNILGTSGGSSSDGGKDEKNEEKQKNEEPREIEVERFVKRKSQKRVEEE